MTKMHKNPPKEKSAPNGHATGSGSGVKGGKHKIEDSSPSHEHGLGRKPNGKVLK